MRIGLGGKGDPIPTDPFLPPEDGLAVQEFYMADGGIFVPQDYIDLGYTRFQVWCVGASGGYGGMQYGGLKWGRTKISTTITEELWSDILLYMEKYLEYTEQDIPEPYTTVPEWVESIWPAVAVIGETELHNFNQKTYLLPYLRPHVQWGPGAPGGGGLEVVTGDLADLPEAIGVVVGSAGANAPIGHVDSNGLWTPEPPLDKDEGFSSSFTPYNIGATFGEEWPNEDWPAALAAWENLQEWVRQWPEPHEEFGPPEAGDDGGYSAFGEIAKASGGKAGAPSKEWDGDSFEIEGSGGDGGVGGSDVAGGGAPGSEDADDAGVTGTYAAGIGQGGGGGHGGNNSVATDGGHGSLSSSNLSIYGQRGVPSKLLRPYPTTINDATGEPNGYSDVGSVTKVNPGAGGGARILGTGLYGSRATGYSPDGAVFVRVS